MRLKKTFAGTIFLLAAVIGIAGCSSNASRMGMVREPSTGLQYGSVIEKSLFVDPQQFRDKTIKVTTRNTSGDSAFDLGSFTNELQGAYVATKRPMSPSVSRSTSTSIAGISAVILRPSLHSWAGPSAGLADIAQARMRNGNWYSRGRSVQPRECRSEDTYIIVVEVASGLPNSREIRRSKNRCLGLVPLQETEIVSSPFKRNADARRGLRRRRNVGQAAVAGEVKRRLVRIISDVI